MVNPGRHYKKYKDFWEKVLPQMGHKLGNHTWHHHGAKNPEEAEFEIGEVSKLIWKLYPEDTKLNVFASGGGELWGGRRWHRTSKQFQAIPEKYYLIDLYDGKHPGIELNTNFSKELVTRLIDNAIAEKKHQAFIFHKIGPKNVKDFLRKIINNFNYTFDGLHFSYMLQYMNGKRDQIWMAPIIDIIKYETEFLSSKFDILSNKQDKIVARLKITSNPKLYDQELSLLIPSRRNLSPEMVLQNKNKVSLEKLSGDRVMCNIKPYGSEIIIVYN